MNKIGQKFDIIREQLRTMQEEFQQAGLNHLKEAVKQVFNESPDLKCIVWTQFSPYFNDGDECVFRVHEMTFSNAEGDDIENISEYGEYDGENENVWATTIWTHRSFTDAKVNWELCSELDYFIQMKDMEDVMKQTFGNHVKIIATREGFKIEDYSHD